MDTKLSPIYAKTTIFLAPVGGQHSAISQLDGGRKAEIEIFSGLHTDTIIRQKSRYSPEENTLVTLPGC